MSTLHATFAATFVVLVYVAAQWGMILMLGIVWP